MASLANYKLTFWIFEISKNHTDSYRLPLPMILFPDPEPSVHRVYGTTNAVYGTTNADAGVGIGMKGDSIGAL